MREQRELKLLREYVRGLLSEDDGGDVAADLMAGAVDAAPYGMSYGGKSVFSAFVEPFTDAAKVTIGKTKELAVRTKTLLKTVLESALTTVIPFLSNDYKKIFANERKQLQQIQNEYGEAYDNVMATFDQSDIKALAFMYDPLAAGMMLNYFGGKAALSTALEVVDTLSGGWLSKNFGGLSGSQRRKKRSSGRSGAGSYEMRASKTSSRSSMGGGGDFGLGGGSVDEAVQRLDEKVTVDAVKQALEQPSAAKLRGDVQKIVKGTLSHVLRSAQAIMSARNVDHLMKLAGGGDVVQKLQQLPEGERQQAEQVILETMKRASREFFVKNLEGQLKKALDQGVPQTSQYVKDYQQVISKIKSM